MTEQTRDPVNQNVVDVAEQFGFARLGLMNNQVWHDDPRRLLFTASRYKFVSKMFSGKHNVLEVGCGDGFFSRIVKQEVGELTCTDYDSLFILDAQERNIKKWNTQYKTHDMLAGHVQDTFDAAYSLDVLEHIPMELEDVFISNICKSLSADAVLIVGMPSIESQEFASPLSKAGHINCKTGADLKRTMERFFKNVFMFSMNDEVVHTGFAKMAHYIMALCVSPKT